MDCSRADCHGETRAGISAAGNGTTTTWAAATGLQLVPSTLPYTVHLVMLQCQGCARASWIGILPGSNVNEAPSSVVPAFVGGTFSTLMYSVWLILLSFLPPVNPSVETMHSFRSKQHVHVSSGEGRGRSGRSEGGRQSRSKTVWSRKPSQFVSGW